MDFLDVELLPPQRWLQLRTEQTHELLLLVEAAVRTRKSGQQFEDKVLALEQLPLLVEVVSP